MDLTHAGILSRGQEWATRSLALHDEWIRRGLLERHLLIVGALADALAVLIVGGLILLIVGYPAYGAWIVAAAAIGLLYFRRVVFRSRYQLRVIQALGQISKRVVARLEHEYMGQQSLDHILQMVVPPGRVGDHAAISDALGRIVGSRCRGSLVSAVGEGEAWSTIHRLLHEIEESSEGSGMDREYVGEIRQRIGELETEARHVARLYRDHVLVTIEELRDLEPPKGRVTVHKQLIDGLMRDSMLASEMAQLSHVTERERCVEIRRERRENWGRVSTAVGEIRSLRGGIGFHR